MQLTYEYLFTEASYQDGFNDRIFYSSRWFIWTVLSFAWGVTPIALSMLADGS